MADVVIKLPDIGEGIAEAEISEWHVETGDWIQEDDIIGVVLTDKAAVEIPASLAGKVTWRAGEVGDMLSIGAPFVKIDADSTAGEHATEQVATGEDENVDAEKNNDNKSLNTKMKSPKAKKIKAEAAYDQASRRSSSKVLAAAAVRKRAADLGVDLSQITGSGPEGRVTHADLDRRIAGGVTAPTKDAVTETKIVGLRRKIADHLSIANANIPAITIVEEIDVTELEHLRTQMNADRDEAQSRLTMLPFIMRGVVVARHAVPQVNARYDDDSGILSTHEAVHFGVATQTDGGLMVPVMRHAECRSVRDMAAEIARLASGAREGALTREELRGSTITVTSLGPLGAVATTPIINHPEVAIVGVNRKQVRPLWDGREFRPREVMNISASFDHRIVDGWEAAIFIDRLKTLLEAPALLFASAADTTQLS